MGDPLPTLGKQVDEDQAIRIVEEVRFAAFAASGDVIHGTGEMPAQRAGYEGKLRRRDYKVKNPHFPHFPHLA